jgi:hypothetical protein
MNEMTTVETGGALAAPGGYDPFASYGADMASTSGDFLKFSKGEWLKGQNDDEVPLDTKLVINMDEMQIGWIRWQDKKPQERQMGLLAGGHKPEARAALGYTNPDEWEVDKDDKPQDPWSFTNELPAADPETGEQMIISMSSKGGIGAIGNLCKAYAKEYKQKPGQVPVIALQRDSYKHKEYGKTYVPVLTIVGWMANSAVPQPAVDGGDEPETPAAEKAAGAKTRF